MKKYLSLLLTLALIFSLAGSAQAVSAATIKLNKVKASMSIDDTISLKLSGTSKSPKWSSNNKKIATVNSKGTVKAIKEGNASITATLNGKKYVCKVTVKKDLEVSTLEDIVKVLKDKNLIEGEETEMFADMIGAEKGISYLNVEIYEFNRTTDAYKKILKTNQIRLEDLNMDIDISAINEKFVLLCNFAENKEEIIKAFNSLKIK